MADYVDQLVYDVSSKQYFDQDGYPVNMRMSTNIITPKYEKIADRVDTIGNMISAASTNVNEDLIITTKGTGVGTLATNGGASASLKWSSTDVQLSKIKGITNDIVIEATGAGASVGLKNTSSSGGTLFIIPGGTDINYNMLAGNVTDYGHKFQVKGKGIVDCASGYMEFQGPGTGQAIPATTDTLVTYDTSNANTFATGFWTITGNNTFQNTSGRTVTVMISASARGVWGAGNGSMNMWISRSGAVGNQYGQTKSAANGISGGQECGLAVVVLQLVNNESFTVKLYCSQTMTLMTGIGCLLNVRYMP